MSSEETKNLDSTEDSEPKVEDVKHSLPRVFRCTPDDSLGMRDQVEDDNKKGGSDASKAQHTA